MAKKTVRKFFYKHWFFVEKKVFLPRFETEQLVDLTIDYAQNLLGNKLEVLEIGVGSGVVALSLALANPHWKIDAIDIDEKAINLTRKNQHQLGIKSVTVWKSNMFNNVKKKYDLIIANLPYVEINSPLLEKGVLEWDPKAALFAKEKGLALIKVLLKEARNFLKKRFLIALEIGWGQGPKITALVQELLPSSNIKVVKDFNQIERFVFIYQIN